MPQHTHAATVTGGGAVTGNVAVPASTSTAAQTEGGVPGTTTVLGPVSVSGRTGALYSTSTPDTTLKPFAVSLQATAPTVQNGMTGNNTPVPLRNPYLGVNFCIALQGVFPSRG